MSDGKEARVEYGSLWRNTTKDGTVFFSGNHTNKTQITIWPNKFKKTDKHPDYIMWLSPKKKNFEEDKKEDPTSSFDGMTFPPNIPF